MSGVVMVFGGVATAILGFCGLFAVAVGIFDNSETNDSRGQFLRRGVICLIIGMVVAAATKWLAA